MPAADPLADLDEAAFRTQVLVPLLAAMGYRDVDHTHGPNELGKDIVAWEEARDGSREYTAVVAKVGNINAQAAGDARTIATQVQQAFGSDIRGKTDHRAHRARTVVVTTTGSIRQEAREAILVQFDDRTRAHVKFWDGAFIRERLAHYQARTFAGDLDAVRQATVELDSFDIQTTIGPDGVTHEILPREDETLIANVVLSFPQDPEADDALSAFDRFVEDGDPVTVSGAYIDSFEQHEELARLFGNEMPAELFIGPAEAPRAHPIAVVVHAAPVPLRYEGLLIRCVRSGRRRSRFETGPEHPLHVTLKTERHPEGRTSLTTSLALRLAGHTATSAERAVTLWTAVLAGAEYDIQLVPGDKVLIQGGASESPAQPFPLQSYVANLAAIERRLGWDLLIPEEVTERDQLDAAELRSILETGVYTYPFSSHTLTYTPEPDTPDPFFAVLASGSPFWFRTGTDTAAYEILGRTLDLGTGLTLASIRLKDGEAARARDLLDGGTPTVELRFEAAGDKTVTKVFNDFLPDAVRARFEELADRYPPVLDWSEAAVAELE